MDIVIFRNCPHKKALINYSNTHNYLLEIIDLDGYEFNLKLFHPERQRLMEEIQCFAPLELVTDRLVFTRVIDEEINKKKVKRKITEECVDRYICRFIL